MSVSQFLHSHRVLCLGTALLAFITPAPTAIRYVRAGAAGTGTGLSWQNAYTELVPAIAAAQPGDEIWIAKGIYLPDYNPATGLHSGSRTARFRLKSNVSIYGGFVGTESARNPRNWAANRTILSGDIGSPGDFSDNTRTLCVSDAGAVGILVEGVIFAGGNADDPRELGNDIVGRSGGAVYLSASVAEFRHCVFVGNYATYGGAISTQGNVGSNLTVTNCLFSGNSVQYTGGAIDFQSFTGRLAVLNCTITGNRGDRGAAISTNLGVTCTYINNAIHGNTATSNAWHKVETGISTALVARNNILEKDLQPNPGINNLTVSSAGFARTPSPGLDGIWGTRDDVLDATLQPDSPAVGFADASYLSTDSTDADADGNVKEATPFDLLHRPRLLLGGLDAGAFEYTGEPPGISSVTALQVNALSRTEATLSVEVDPGGLLTTLSLYLDDDLLTSQQVPADSAPYTFEQPLAGLTPGVTYRAQAVVANADGPGRAMIFEFTTPDDVITIESPLYRGGSVPGAGVPGSGVPGGATFGAFGVPSINIDGDIAVRAAVRSSQEDFSAIFAGGQMIARTGGRPTALPGLAFGKLKDPLFNREGLVVFQAEVGARNSAKNWSLWKWSPIDSSLKLIELEGDPLTQKAQPRWKSFDSVALSAGFSGTELVAFEATLTDGEKGLWLAAGDNPPLSAMHAGMYVPVDGPSRRMRRVAGFRALGANPGAFGQGNGATGSVLAELKLADGRTALARLSVSYQFSYLGTAQLDFLAVEGSSFPGIAGKIAKILWTAQDAAGFPGLVVSLKDETTHQRRVTLVRQTQDENGVVSWEVLAARGSLSLPGDEAAVTALHAPALARAQTGEGVAAVVAQIAGGTATRTSNRLLLLFHEGQPVRVIARTGSQAADLPTGVNWESFPSMALPEGAQGPVFVGTLVRGSETETRPRIDASNNIGVWALDSEGSLKLVVRTGDAFDSTRTIRSVSLLQHVTGSASQARSAAPGGHLVLRAMLSDGSEALLQVQLP